jgi:CRISPR-associated protein Cas6
VYWQEDEEDSRAADISQEIVDVSFRLKCKSLPLDHAFALSKALNEVLPWLEKEDRAGVHLIHGAESGNGWIRPHDPTAVLYLSRRTRLTLRLPEARVPAAKILQGKTLVVDGNTLMLGEVLVRPLNPVSTVYARYVIMNSMNDDAAFLDEAAQRLSQDLGIRVKKMMSGRSRSLRLPEEEVNTRSLMIDGLEAHESIRLQQRGLGPRRRYGCGLFIPHKSIDAITKVHDS